MGNASIFNGNDALGPRTKAAHTQHSKLNSRTVSAEKKNRYILTMQQTEMKTKKT